MLCVFFSVCTLLYYCQRWVTWARFDSLASGVWSEPPVHVINSLEMSASPADVWDQLIAADWPTWYPCRMFASRTVPASCLRAWISLGILSARYRVYSQNSCRMSGSPGTREELVCTLTTWLIIPTQTAVAFWLKTQRGFVARLFKVFTPNLMNSNQKWLEALAVRSSATRIRAEFPPTASSLNEEMLT